MSKIGGELNAEMMREVKSNKAWRLECEQLRAELNEQARLLGISAEKELALRAENERLKAELAEAKKDAERYQFLLLKGLQRAWVSLSTDCDGENFAQFQCTFNIPEPPNLPYEDDEGLQWADKDFDAAIDLAIKAMKGK